MENPKKDLEGPPADGLAGEDRQGGDKRDSGTEPMPEGLQRERKGPLNKDSGRR